MGDSLWDKSSGDSLYKTIKKLKVGDVVTVYISTQSSAVQQAGTRTTKTTDVNANFFDLWDQVAVNNQQNYDSLRKMQNFRVGGGDQYNGVGQTSRKSEVKTVLSSMVTEILPGGNLVIVGEYAVNVNDETETIRVSGVIRPEDIAEDNSIKSYQIAQVQVSVKGEGVVGSKQTPGIMSKMFNWLF